MRRGALLYFIVVGLLALPLEASANAGTPLMWASMIHLAIGNALIGLLEGCLLTWWFGVPHAKAVALMIPANYASAWLGGVFILGEIVKALPMDLTNGWLWFVPTRRSTRSAASTRSIVEWLCCGTGGAPSR